MRRILGTDGTPTTVPSMLSTQRALLDLTSERTQEVINGRAVFVDLWIHALTPTAPIASLPSWWSGMTGSTPQFDLSTQQAVCVVTSDKNVLRPAVASSSHLIAAEGLGPADATALQQQLGLNGSALFPVRPAHILQRYVMNAGEALFVVHNFDMTFYAPSISSYPAVRCWGYWTIEGEEDISSPLRPLQPDPNDVPTTFSPTIVYTVDSDIDPENGTIIHTVADDSVDEITLDLRIGSYNNTASGTGLLEHVLNFENGAGVWPYAGAVDSYTVGSNYLPADTEWVRWFDGIPMSSAGAIRLSRLQPGASYARGYFRRR